MAGGPGVAKPATLVGTTPSGVEHQLDTTFPNTRFAREGRKQVESY